MSTCMRSLLDFAPVSGHDWHPALRKAVADEDTFSSLGSARVDSGLR
jgi:hypothetical protein